MKQLCVFIFLFFHKANKTLYSLNFLIAWSKVKWSNDQRQISLQSTSLYRGPRQIEEQLKIEHHTCTTTINNLILILELLILAPQTRIYYILFLEILLLYHAQNYNSNYNWSIAMGKLTFQHSPPQFQPLLDCFNTNFDSLFQLQRDFLQPLCIMWWSPLILEIYSF